MNELVVDLRSEDEYARGHLPEAVNIPHDTFIQRAQEGQLDAKTRYLLHCRSGNRVALVMNSVNGLDLENVQQRFDAFAAEHPESL